MVNKMITRTFTISPVNLDMVKARLDKLSKKAVKLGIPVPVITETREWKEKKVKINNLGKEIIEWKPRLDVTVSSEEIKYGEYTHIASLDHTIGTSPIINMVPGYTLPETYYNAGCNCDHCGINRYRKNTYIFKSIDGYKQVGSSCLKEFFGIDPTANLEFVKSLNDISEWNDESFGGYIAPEYDIKMALTIAYNLVLEHGYVSNKIAMEKDIESTASLTSFYYYPPMMNDADEQIAYQNFMDKVHNTDETIIDGIISWGKEHFMGSTGEYAHNMRIILDLESVPRKYLGYLVSVIACYNKSKVESKVSKRFDNAFIGTVGSKITVNVLVNKIIEIAGNYGYSYVNLMSEVETGNIIVWISSSMKLSEGSNVTLKGTIKALNNRNGNGVLQNQTIMTRCKVVE